MEAFSRMVEKVRWRRAAGLGPMEKDPRRRRVAGKVALIACEEKNNSLIFVN